MKNGGLATNMEETEYLNYIVDALKVWAELV